MAFKKSPAAKAHALTAEQKQAKDAALKSLLQEAQDGVAAVQSTEQWKKFLGFAASFYQYSPYNWAMIYRQNPEATHVAGFNTWKNKHNRFVKKGEKGLVILRPIMRKAEDKQTGESSYFLAGFASTYVFDITQTEGEPVPAPVMPVDVSDDCPLWSAYADTLAIKVEEQGVKVDFEATFDNGANGSAQKTVSGLIVKVRAGMSAGQTLKTLVHELAHVCLHVGGGIPALVVPSKKDAPGVVVTKAAAEVEAESVAYVVCKRLGLDTSGYSFPYLAHWKAQGGEGATFHLLGRVQKAVKHILGWLGDAEESEA